MTTDALLAMLAELGLSVQLDASGQPRLRGNAKDAQTVLPQLLRVLKLPVHRGEIVRRLSEQRLKEWLWTTGWVSRALTREQAHPAGAWWWRYQGDTVWQPVPGTPGVATMPPCV